MSDITNDLIKIIQTMLSLLDDLIQDQAKMQKQISELQNAIQEHVEYENKEIKK